MAWRAVLRTFTATALCLVLALQACPQTGGFGNIGPSKGEVVGIIVGASAGIGVAVYLIYRGTHKHASIQGCVTSEQNALSLGNEKDKKTYKLVGDTGTLRSGQRVALSGKKTKGSAGKLVFEVQKLAKDFGACQPPSSPPSGS
jgi:hypothetical protein